MKWSKALLLGIAVFSFAFSGPTLRADDDDRRVPQVVTVAFGAGLNTAAGAPPHPLNDHVVPRVITVRTRLATSNRPAVPGVVNFVVSGLHQIFVYFPEITLQQIQACAATKPFVPPATNLFLNCNVNSTDLFYQGINPGGANPGGPAVLATQSNLQNRVEPVGFTEPGLYLVICNVNPHFTGGMFAWVRVVANDDDWRDSDGGDEHRDHN
jgi:hypothetical protein